MSFNDPEDVESVLQTSIPAVATPALVRSTPNGVAAGTESPRAVQIGVPTPPAASPALVRATPNGIAAGTESPRAAQIGVPPAPGITSSITPVAAGGPTLATAGPVQGTAAPRIAGVQMVPPAPPATQTATQMSQPANAPQALQGISTLLQRG